MTAFAAFALLFAMMSFWYGVHSLSGRWLHRPDLL
jgi:hypothetical protein